MSNADLTVNTEVSAILSPKQLLVVGCEICYNHMGKIIFYNAENLELIEEIIGDG